MIHTIYTMTIGRYGQLDKTQDAKLLRRWFNPLPVGWFKGRCDRFMDQVREIFDADSDLYKEFDRVYMVNKLLRLSILYDALYNYYMMLMPVQAILKMLDPGFEITSIDNIKKAVKDATGIEVNEAQDIFKVKAEFDRMTDKFRERFPEGKVEEPMSFYRAALAVFLITEQTYNESMKMVEFAELQKMARERQKQYEKQIQKHGATG